MREILFRGKTFGNGKWVYGDLVQNTQDKQTLIIIAETKESVSYKEVDKDTIGQFTGLTDKNGTKIFEGDILQLCAGTYPIKVIYDGLGWKFIRNGKCIKGAFECDIIHDIELCKIVGNIHDNPELLDKE